MFWPTYVSSDGKTNNNNNKQQHRSKLFPVSSDAQLKAFQKVAVACCVFSPSFLVCQKVKSHQNSSYITFTLVRNYLCFFCPSHRFIIESDNIRNSLMIRSLYISGVWQKTSPTQIVGNGNAPFHEQKTSNIIILASHSSIIQAFTKSQHVFLWLSLQSHYRVTDEAVLAETSKYGLSTSLRMCSLLLKERTLYFYLVRQAQYIWNTAFSTVLWGYNRENVYLSTGYDDK